MSFRPMMLMIPAVLGLAAVGLDEVLSVGWAQEAAKSDAGAPAATNANAGTTSTSSASATPSGSSASGKKARPEPVRVSVAVAKEKAALLHDVYSETLDTVHHRYFHGDRAVIPARAMEDIFDSMKRKHGYEGRWISASFTPMSIDHEPETPFEKEAAKKLMRGEEFHEGVEDGFYRRAGSISLSGGCVTCHQGSFAPPSPGRKFAGLVISIPVLPQEPGQ